MSMRREVDIGSSILLSCSLISQKEWGALASDFMTSQWKTLYFYLQNTKPSDSFISVEKCLDYLAISAGDATLILFSCIKILLPMVSTIHVLGVYMKNH